MFYNVFMKLILMAILALILTVTSCYKEVKKTTHPTPEKIEEPTTLVTPTINDSLDTAQEEILVPVKKEVEDPLEEEIVSAKKKEDMVYSDNVIELGKRIIKWKRVVDRNIWFECGKKYTEEEIHTAAYAWADALITAHTNTTYQLKRGWRKGKDLKISLRESVGIVINESRFDRCAVGPHPRKFAYKRGILIRKKNTNSHTLFELEKLFNHPSFSGHLADIGPGQKVVRVPKSGGWESVKDYFTLKPGIQKFFDELAYRGRLYNTTKPSSRWPGSRNHKWYTIEVLRQSHFIFQGTPFK